MTCKKCGKPFNRNEEWIQVMQPKLGLNCIDCRGLGTEEEKRGVKSKR